MPETKVESAALTRVTKVRFLPREPMDVVDLAAMEPNTGCWLWAGIVDDGGYGRTEGAMRHAGRLAHRAVYALLRGPIPKGMVLHHVCFQRCCVNPEHLVAMTESAHRELHGHARRRVQCRCGVGLPAGRLICLECKRAKSARARAAKGPDRCPMNHTPTLAWVSSKACAKCQGVYARRRAARDARRAA